MAPRRATAFLMLTVLVVAANLRAAITTVGPVIDQIGSDRGLSAGLLGLLGAIPLLTFAAVSPAVHGLARRFGTERTVGVAMWVLAVGTAVRTVASLPGALWVGTVLLAAAIAVANVLIPVLVKRDFSDRVPVVTGAYTAAMSGVAAVASGISVPLASAGGWQLALGAWAAPALLGAVLWLPRLKRTTANGDGTDDADGTAAANPAAPAVGIEAARGGLWSSPLAWQVAVFMGLQSSTYYLLVTWLPKIEADDLGTSAATAGWLLFAMQIAGICAGLAIGPVLHRLPDQRFAAAGVSALIALAMVGLLVAPAWHVLWVVLAGVSTGASLVVALTLFAARTRTPHDAGRLSGMAQGVGYLLAAGGPVGAGLLHGATGSWASTIIAVIAIALVQLVAGMLAGRNRYVGEPALPIAPA